MPRPRESAQNAECSTTRVRRNEFGENGRPSKRRNETGTQLVSEPAARADRARHPEEAETHVLHLNPWAYLCDGNMLGQNVLATRTGDKGDNGQGTWFVFAPEERFTSTFYYGPMGVVSRVDEGGDSDPHPEGGSADAEQYFLTDATGNHVGMLAVNGSQRDALFQYVRCVRRGRGDGRPKRPARPPTARGRRRVQLARPRGQRVRRQRTHRRRSHQRSLRPGLHAGEIL